MPLPKYLKRFAKQEDGAVTVDWVVLTAGIVGFAVLVMVNINASVIAVADRIAHFLDYHVH